MGCGIAPVIQVVEICDLGGVGGREGKRKPEPLKIGSNGLQRGVLLAQLQLCGELGLNSGPKRNRNGGRAYLGAF